MGSPRGSARIVSPRLGPRRNLLWLLLLVPSLTVSTKVIWDYLHTPGFGEFCTKACRGGYCYAPADNIMHAYCTRSCASGADCAPDYECVQPFPDRSSFCRRTAHGKSGTRCAAAEECLSGLCIEYVVVDGQRGRYRNQYCVEPCPSSSACPEGTQCEEVDGTSVCSPRATIEQDARRRFDMERRIGIENEMLMDRRLARVRHADGGGLP